ncbi:hypothetical protein GZ178_04005 [Dermatophilus congolensis]|nr:hypothetical protein [Dermatophilus congolensis]MBO3151633.1 hypothetical protein [Dermatophilus congolensis]MBO3161367.1 hypothetical protein [Dermatophilus congolensis]MBO3162915.1 hypothetical protein [Dermatophilus congolensis]MBO3176468.1 hypothetical protein [Dermatophilus congolensis]
MGDVQPYAPQVNKTPRPNVRALLSSPAAESHNQQRRLPPLEEEEHTHATDTRALLAVPQRLQTARSVPPTRAIIGALIIGVLACAVVFARWWFTERQAAEHTVPAASTHAGKPSPSGTAGTADKHSQTTPAAITVHVAGKVAKPGVVTVPAESRASQAIAAAGGFARGSDARSINMAKPLSDGEQIIVAALGEPAPAAAVSSPGTSTTAAGKVNLNSADQTTLETLPGVGPVMAGKIIKWRTDNGRFTRVEDLNEVSGVGEKTFAKLAQLVTV